MAVGIQSQPITNSLNAAYRPILITGSMSGAMPIVFCDIYFDGIYYKTISKTDQSTLFPVFDIQDAAQEYLGKFLALNGSPVVQQANELFVQCQCKLRGSSISGDGFITPDPTVPIQGTMTTFPVPGTGTASNLFWILNATLQVEDNQSLIAHLATFKNGTWAAEAYPMSHRRSKYRIDGSDYFPFFYHGAEVLRCIKIYYTKRDGTTGNSEVCDTVFPTCATFTGGAITWDDNGDGTQTFHLDWTAPTSVLYLITAQYKIAGSTDPWTDFIMNASTAPRDLVLPIGLYTFRFKTSLPLNLCDPYISAEFPDQGIPKACVAPVVTETALPDGEELVAYNHSMVITGTGPFTLSAVTKPAWMTIAISGNNVVFSGTPPTGSAGVGLTVEFTVNHPCDGATDTVTQTIDVIVTPIGNLVQVVYGTTAPSVCVNFPNNVYLDPPNLTLISGIIVYTDITLTTPLAGQNFIRIDPGGNIFEIHPVTGEVGIDTGTTC